MTNTHAKAQGQRSFRWKDRVDTKGQTDGHDLSIALPFSLMVRFQVNATQVADVKQGACGKFNATHAMYASHATQR